MDDDVTSWMDCLYYYCATLPIFLVHGCAASVQGVLTLCLLVQQLLCFFEDVDCVELDRGSSSEVSWTFCSELNLGRDFCWGRVLA